jgi:hypothetical protein
MDHAAPHHGLHGRNDPDAVLDDAFRVLDGIDDHRDLHSGLSMVFFVASCALGVWAFFVLSDISIWSTLWGADIGEFAARGITVVSWALIFPVWIMAFAGFVTLLHRLGIRDVRSGAVLGLAALSLGRDDLVALRDDLRLQACRHRKIFHTVISDMLTKD